MNIKCETCASLASKCVSTKALYIAKLFFIAGTRIRQHRPQIAKKCFWWQPSVHLFCYSIHLSSIRAQRPHCHGHLAATPCSDTSTQAYSAHRTLAAVPCNSTKLLRCRQPFDSSALHPHTSRPAPKRTYPTHPVLEARTPIASPSGEKVCRTETHQSDPKGWVCFVAQFPCWCCQPVLHFLT